MITRPIARFLSAIVLISALLLGIASSGVQAVSRDLAPQPGRPDQGGYWYRVRPGDTWYRVSLITKVPIRKLWEANPNHHHPWRWLYIGHRLWIPTGPECPIDFDDYPDAIATYLNGEDATLSGLTRWLQGCNVLTDELGSVGQYALRGVIASDIVVVIHDLASDEIAPVGKLLVYHKTADGYELAHQADTFGKVALLQVEDVNANGRREIIYTDTTCGAHTCYSELHVDEWDGSAYRDWILGQPEMPYADYTIADTTSAGSGQEIIVHGGIIASIGAGPQRAWTETYISPDGGPYQLYSKVYDASDCLYHHILDANELYNQAYPAGDYGPAIAAYEAAIADDTLTSCAYTDFPDELEVLRDFARFRLVVAYSTSDEPDQAASVRAQITSPALAGAADAFLTSYEATSDLAQACAATTAYAEANSEAWEFLADWGYANPSFSPEELCSGSGTISGRLWADQCSIAEDGSLPPGPGCVETDGGQYQANGIMEAGEPGIDGVTVRLLPRDCPLPGMAIQGIEITGPDGRFTFTGLTSGTYCLVIDPGDGENASILIPGTWTNITTVTDGTARIPITLTPGEDRTDVNLGWDFQFD